MDQSIVDWIIDTDDNNVIWLTLDQKNSSTNLLSSSVLIQLGAVIEDIARRSPRAVVIRSGKTSGFIAGADIKEFIEINNQQEALIMIKRGQTIFNQIEALPCPTIAIIEGFCMGGGTELVLACDYRIALDDAKTKIGLPEIKIGIHPAFGGIVRTTAMMNPLKALEMMLSGRALTAHQAKAIGLIDLVQPRRQLQRAALQFALHQPAKQQMPTIGKLISLPGIRSLVSMYLKKQVAKKVAKQHYPAPYALLDVWSAHYGNKKHMMTEEANSITRLMQGNTVQQLIRVFFLQTRLKSLGNKKFFTPKHVHVIGAGTMGGDIAAWCALQGLTVTLQDRKPEYLSTAIKRANQLFAKRIKPLHKRNAAADRLIPDCRGTGVAKADVVIEAIFEDIDAKQAIYAEIEPRMKKDAILVTNTSSIPLETLAKSLKKPNKLVGVHFFNPVAMMPLIEIVSTVLSDEKSIKKALAFTLHIGKLPLPVKSAPGFLVNRILMPYLSEAIQLLDEGIAPEAIDKAAVDFGMPMGPIQLADTVGLDICLSVVTNLTDAFGGEVPASLQRHIDNKHLGKKSGRGLYQYHKGKPVKNKNADVGDQKTIQNRLVFRILNESANCIADNIVKNQDLLDAGIIFGTGFAPFRGGPLNYSSQQHIEKLTTVMDQYASQYGERFKPVSGWQLIK